MQRRLFSMIVNNQPGVLSRIAGLFTRRGYNIDSLTVSATNEAAFSRITVVVVADDSMLEQIVKQVDKLIDVKVVAVLDAAPVARRELALIKVKKLDAAALMDAISEAHAHIVNTGERTVTVETIGTLEEIDGFVQRMDAFGIVEMARTGLVALSRGDGCLYDQI